MDEITVGQYPGRIVFNQPSGAHFAQLLETALIREAKIRKPVFVLAVLRKNQLAGSIHLHKGTRAETIKRILSTGLLALQEMEAFLRKVSDYIVSVYGEETGKICIVLPNRRGGLFLKKHLAAAYSKPVWAPQITSVEDFIWKLSGLSKTDLAEQLFIFYSIYRKAEGEKAENFEAFCKWAPTLLADFSEADGCLADTEKLFGNLSDIRAIENWSLGEVILTDFQKQYLHFWSSIGSWYRAFRQYMLEEKKGYSGLAYRVVAEKISSPDILPGYDAIIFAGLNAMNPAEEKIVSVLHSSGRAELLWDVDRYYFEDDVQEAGRFFRRYRKSYFKPKAEKPVDFVHVEDHMATDEKNITVVGVARMVSQAKAAVHFLEGLDKQKRYSPSTAVVLADEQLLLPLLHALPEEAQHVNITMGFPLRNTPVASLVNAVFTLHENAERFSIRSRDGEVKYYHNDVIRLLRHPYIRQLTAGSGLGETLERYITRFNIVFCSPAQLRKAAGETTAEAFEKFAPLLGHWNDASAAISGLRQCIAMLRPCFATGEKEFYNIETEYLYQLSLIVKRASTLHSRWPFASDLRSLRALITQQIASTSLPFSGEPVAGLQVMGLLETRTLDFENVVLLSANENILPAGRSQPTFIIYELRAAFGLPVWNDRDAIAAYNFYRLIQRAKNIYIVYNTDQDLFGNREKSRFVTQLLHELPAVNKKTKITETIFDAGIPLAPGPPEEIAIPKNEAVMKRLLELAEKGLSPSLLNSFRSCPLQFYFHYVAGIREPDEVEETIEANTLGTIIHGALEELYKPVIGQKIGPDFFRQAEKAAEHTCDAMFAKHFSAEESSLGKNLLAKRIALRYILNYLAQEKKNIVRSPAIVAALETDLAHALSIRGKNVQLIGQADRIDRAETHIRLIDYKTGKAERKELEIKEWEEITGKPEIHKSFQLLMYAWLYSRSTGNEMPVQSGIVSFRKLKEGLMTVQTPEGDFLFPETLNTFEMALRNLLDKLFDPQTDFTQTSDENICRLCAFNTICRR